MRVMTALAGRRSSSHDFTASWMGPQYVFLLILDAGWCASGIEGVSTEPGQGPDRGRYVAWFPTLPTDAVRKWELSEGGAMCGLRGGP